MSILKLIRKARGLSVDDLSRRIEVDLEDVKKWEEDEKSISSKALSSIAYEFGLSSEELALALKEKKENTIKLQTNCYYLSTNRNIEDGWWGHFGVRLKNDQKSKWFPITIGAAERLSITLANIETSSDWVIIETLNNRVLVLKPSTVSRLWILDDNQDQPDGDWELSIDSYCGLPGEFYKGLEEYCSYSESDDIEVSNLVINQVDKFTDIYDLGIDEVQELVSETHIYCVDGSCFSHYVEDSRLAQIASDIEFDIKSPILDLGNEGYELYIPSDNLSLIDMPKRRVDAASREIYKELAGSEDEN